VTNVGETLEYSYDKLIVAMASCLTVELQSTT